MAAAAAAAVRSVIRPATILRRAVAVAEMRSASASPRVSTLCPSTTRRFLRCPVQASFCLESMLPLHSATASALMTSMLSVSKSGFGYLSEDIVFAKSLLSPIHQLTTVLMQQLSVYSCYYEQA